MLFFAWARIIIAGRHKRRRFPIKQSVFLAEACPRQSAHTWPRHSSWRSISKSIMSHSLPVVIPTRGTVINYCEGGEATEGLLPAGSEKHEVLQTWSIHAAILPSCQFFTILHFQFIAFNIIWVVKIRNTSEAVLRPQHSPWPSY